MRSRMSGVTARSFSGDGIEAGLLEEGLQVAAELLDGQGADVLGVEPDGLGIEGVFFREIDHGVGAVDAFEREQRRRVSSRVRNSRSFLGDQPSRQRKLMKAWGRKPASR